MAETTFRGRDLESYLLEFHELCVKNPGPIKHSLRLQNKSGKKLLVAFMVHGDEFGSIPAIVDWVRDLQVQGLPFEGELTVVLGNSKAAKLQRRCFEADLNRVFNPEAKDSFEKRRAEELKPLLREADLFIDLHQTISPSELPFYVFSFHEPSILWARALGASEVLVTHQGSYSEGNMGTDEFAMEFGVPSMTFEAFERGFSEEAYRASAKILDKAVKLFSLLDPKNLEYLRIEADKEKPLRLFHRSYSETFSDLKMKLRPGLKNFTSVVKGEVLGERGDRSPLFCPSSGYLLFPKYPERDEEGVALPPSPSDLYMLVQEASWDDFK